MWFYGWSVASGMAAAAEMAAPDPTDLTISKRDFEGAIMRWRSLLVDPVRPNIVGPLPSAVPLPTELLCD